jgi:hypothetical protein
MAAPTPVGTAATRGDGVGTAYTGDSPAGIVSDELLMAQIRVNSGANANSLTDLQGYTVLASLTASQGASFYLAKVADATVASNAGVAGYYAFVGSFSAVSAVAVFRVSGAAGAAADDSEVSAITPATTSFVCPALQPTGAERLLLWFVSQGINSSWSFPGGTTEFYDAPFGTNRSIALGYEAWATATDTGTRTVTATLSDMGHAAAIAIAPSGAEPEPGDPNQLVTARAIWTAA